MTRCAKPQCLEATYRRPNTNFCLGSELTDRACPLSDAYLILLLAQGQWASGLIDVEVCSDRLNRSCTTFLRSSDAFEQDRNRKDGQTFNARWFVVASI